MKILINASVIGDKVNGVTVYAIEVIKKLTSHFEKENIPYEVFCYANPYLNFIPPYKIKSIQLPAIVDGVLSRSRSVHRILWNALVLKKKAKRTDVIYSPSSHGCFNCSNQIITIHDLICFNYPSQHLFQFVYFKFLIPEIIKKSTLITISNYSKGNILKRFSIQSNRIHTIYNGADHLASKTERVLGKDFLDKNRLEIGRYFITVGANYPHKNIERLLEVAKDLKNENYKFVIIGIKGSYLKKILNKIEKDDIDNVILFNYVLNEELAALYQYCCANIYISLDEGFGFPPIEAALYNKVSIVSNSSCLPEILEDNVEYVNPYDVKDISNKIKQFINDQEHFNEKYKSKLIQLSRNYIWDDAVKKIQQVLEQIILMNKVH